MMKLVNMTRRSTLPDDGLRVRIGLFGRWQASK